MSGLSRRAFLGGSGALAATAVFGACGGGGGGDGAGGQGGGGGGGEGMRWWDHYSALQGFHKDWAAQQSKALGANITYTYNDVTKAAQALQLANQSQQLPDIYSNTLGLPLSALVKDKWVGEITMSAEAKARLPKGSFTDGVTNLDNKLYGLPLFAFRQYSTATWFNSEIIAKAGIDGDNPPATYDDYRAACKKIKDLGSGASAMTLALGDPVRMRDQMDDLAQAGGFAGFQGLKFTTGEYAYDDDAYVNAIEFWKEMNTDGYIVQGSSNFTVANARTRWASGAAGFFIDGPWCAGGVKRIVEAFVPKLNVGPILKPEATGKVTTYRGAPGAQFFLAGNSKDPEKASKLLESMTTPEYQKGLATGMDQPPLNLDVVATADVIEPYKKVIGFFKETVKAAPQALIKNPQVAQAQALSKPISTQLGNVIQGYLGGDIPDLKVALRKLNSDYEKDREQAIKAANAKGAKVSVDDYAFSDWKPGTDYTHSS
ncbi:MAG TPA: extracellular solute-binding protein [Propionibacteriaceae bacterium]